MLILKGGRIFRKGEFVNSDILITDRIEMIHDSISIKGVEKWILTIILLFLDS